MPGEEVTSCWDEVIPFAYVQFQFWVLSEFVFPQISATDSVLGFVFFSVRIRDREVDQGIGDIWGIDIQAAGLKVAEQYVMAFGNVAKQVKKEALNFLCMLFLYMLNW